MTPMRPRRSLPFAPALARVDLYGVPCPAFRDEAAVQVETEAPRAPGFTGKAALHPANVATINAVSSPSAEEIARAETIVGLDDESPSGLAEPDGKLIEIPVVHAMRRVLAARDALSPPR